MSERNPKAESPGIFQSHIALARLVEVAAATALKAEYEATHDELTGALNRNGLEKYLESAEAPKAMLLVDATNFKTVNDRHGYIVGDQIIVETYRVLSKSVRENDVIARWGGDEFVIILNGGNKEVEQVRPEDENRSNHVHTEYIVPVKKRVAAQMQSFLDERPELRQLNLDLAMGGVVWPGNAPIEGLIAEAEAEMKTHKARQHQNDRTPVV